MIRRIKHILTTAVGKPGAVAVARIPRRKPQRAFTLVEILVVVAIIVILVGLFISTSLDPGAISQTRILLAVATSIAAEYEVDTGTIIAHDTPSTPDDSVERFVLAARMRPTPEAMIPSMGRDQVTDSDGDGYDEILDGWGRKLKYFSANLPDQPGYDETMPHYVRPYFASRGPDGRWGDVRESASAEDQEDSKDNLYSFELD